MIMKVTSLLKHLRKALQNTSEHIRWKIADKLFGTSLTMSYNSTFNDDSEDFEIGDLVKYVGHIGTPELGIVIRKTQSHYLRRVYVVYWIRDQRSTATLGTYISLVQKYEDVNAE